ncbi:hypothetical protein [Lysobacter enzymogenes]|uniref:hypothetical protein n=1 Tax=Lysobacter enzymogenes TaxID=69 RepID=UPI001AF3CB60|nr:hypothetical protein [Lysobacter enzymogenes]QQQ00688.1 hypothetical protein JHW41_21845 [Lysobacter enzymogenes]
MHRLSSLALAGLLCAGPALPAVAAGGNDFCDGIVEVPLLTRSGDDYAGGRCQVDLLRDRPSPLDPAGGLRLHDLQWDTLRRPPATTAAPVRLEVDVGPQNFVDGEALIEWTFESSKTGELRLLVLSLWRSDDSKDAGAGPTRVLAQLYAPGRPDWSLAGPSDDLGETQALAVADLSPKPSLSRFVLVFDGRQATVSVEGGGTHSFPMPHAGWTLVHLRNGVLARKPWQAGEGLILWWPVWLAAH